MCQRIEVEHNKKSSEKSNERFYVLNQNGKSFVCDVLVEVITVNVLFLTVFSWFFNQEMKTKGAGV